MVKCNEWENEEAMKSDEKREKKNWRQKKQTRQQIVNFRRFLCGVTFEMEIGDDIRKHNLCFSRKLENAPPFRFFTSFHYLFFVFCSLLFVFLHLFGSVEYYPNIIIECRVARLAIRTRSRHFVGDTDINRWTKTRNVFLTAFCFIFVT